MRGQELPQRGAAHASPIARAEDRGDGRALGRSWRGRSSRGALLTRIEFCRAQPERREGPLLAHFKPALASQFERSRKSGGARAAAQMGMGAGLLEKIVEIRPIGMPADQTG